ncbi:hypothetical protein SDC9_177211 [bioreactor metagenome]|uniref:Uncharacterized protein n=1 Tax=bioreactor metagenome TaxID=1076179 RepID=A0A645GSC8_9ZZZZ
MERRLGFYRNGARQEVRDSGIRRDLRFLKRTPQQNGTRFRGYRFHNIISDDCAAILDDGGLAKENEKPNLADNGDKRNKDPSP